MRSAKAMIHLHTRVQCSCKKGWGWSLNGYGEISIPIEKAKYNIVCIVCSVLNKEKN